ncbi:MAG: Flp family type IVb pilin [Armatimonadota bacterium]
MRELWRDEDGTSKIEYALLLALIAVVGLAAWTKLGDVVANTARASAESVACAIE